jgi:uncharacterized protein (TIGR03067 family)
MIRSVVKESVRETFDARQDLLRHEIAEFRARLERLNRTLEDRERSKESIIERRVDELLNPNLRWDSSPESSTPFGPNSSGGNGGGPPKDGLFTTLQVQQLRDQGRFDQARFQQLQDPTTVSGAPHLQDDFKLLIGKWECVSHNVSNIKLPQESTVTHPKYVWTIDRTELTSDPGSKSRYALNPNASPKELTVIGNKAMLQCIYELSGDTLRVAFYGRAELARPNSFDVRENPTDSDPLIVIEFKRK